ncbi:MAG: molybdenum cofactor guanylyltransferase MobA [Gammaproteobacteria bacterium]
MSGQNKVSGLILAGGLARRMNQQDKGLIELHGQAMVSYAISALSPLVDELLLSANRNQDRYKEFGYSVIDDGNDQFNGPLAGMLAAMKIARNSTLLVMPCDSPLIETEHLQRLLSNLSEDVDIAVAFDGQRLHPVFVALKTHLSSDLQDYLLSGERKLQTWLNRHTLREVDFSDRPEIFTNINTPEELAALEAGFVVAP